MSSNAGWVPRRARGQIAVVIAPYSPAGSCEAVHLGAARKIESVVRMLHGLGLRIRFVDTAHNPRRYAPTQVYRRHLGGITVACVRPFTWPRRPLGKLANLLVAGRYARRLLADTRIALVWVYNGYAFENRVALQAARRGLRTVLEIEDWPTARDRGVMNIKCWLDLFFMRSFLPRAALVTCVNQQLERRVAPGTRATLLFPGILAPEIIALAARTPFSGPRKTAGYFGGLTPEKGADCILALAETLPADWYLNVTGSGPLGDAFLAAARRNDRVTFRPAATDAELCALMGACDVIVNPHTAIAGLGDGVFPFKVFEALGSGRCLITTALPACGLPLEDAVETFDGSIAALHQCLQSAPGMHARRAPALAAARDAIVALYAEPAMADRIAARLQLALPAGKQATAARFPGQDLRARI